MTAKKKAAKKPLARKAMKKTRGGAQVDFFLKLKTVEGEATSSPTITGGTINYVGLE